MMFSDSSIQSSLPVDMSEQSRWKSVYDMKGDKVVVSDDVCGKMT